MPYLKVHFFSSESWANTVGLVSLPWSKDENRVSNYISNSLAYRGFYFLFFTHILFLFVIIKYI